MFKPGFLGHGPLLSDYVFLSLILAAIFIHVGQRLDVLLFARVVHYLWISRGSQHNHTCSGTNQITIMGSLNTHEIYIIDFYAGFSVGHFHFSKMS